MKYILLICVAFAVYAFAENRLFLRTRRENFGGNVRIAHISDLHKRCFGNGNKRLADRIKREKPDIILITGDLVSRSMTDISNAESLLHELCGTAPIYVIMGNHEKELKPRVFAEYQRIIAENGGKLLRNDSDVLRVKKRELKIYGLDEKLEVYKKNGGYKDLDVLDRAEIVRLLGECPDGEVLLMAHNPFFGEVYDEWGAEYTFSGHVHGGIVRIFGVAMLSPERKMFPKNAKGIYGMKHGKLCVSGGLGKLRLFNLPEIVIYDL